MDQTHSAWRKSTRSDAQGNCVQVSEGRLGTIVQIVRVRDSKDKSGPVLSFGAEPWREFIAGARDGEFDLT